MKKISGPHKRKPAAVSLTKNGKTAKTLIEKTNMLAKQYLAVSKSTLHRSTSARRYILNKNTAGHRDGGETTQ